MRATVVGALGLVGALGPAGAGSPVAGPWLRAGQSIADVVVRHAASFGAAGEPRYHDHQHQAEATLAMAWLSGCALAQGLITQDQAAAGVLAMAGHDLLHDGSFDGSGALEARSADATVALVRQTGLDASALEAIHRVILATALQRPAAARDADDLLCRLGQEADLFGSLTPDLGWQLSEALAHEAMAAGSRFDPPINSYAGRLSLLRAQRPATPAGLALGLAATVADQIATLMAVGDGDADRGAVRLDAMTTAAARSAHDTALAALVAD
jgi:hypothetical protein